MIELVKYNSNKENKNNVSCLTNNIKKEEKSYIYMICPTEIQLDYNKVFIKVDSNGKSNNVQFSVNENVEIIFQK